MGEGKNLLEIALSHPIFEILDTRHPNLTQAISARELDLCQLTVCFGFQSRGERQKGHKSCALQLVLRSKVQSVKSR